MEGGVKDALGRKQDLGKGMVWGHTFEDYPEDILERLTIEKVNQRTMRPNRCYGVIEPAHIDLRRKF